MRGSLSAAFSILLVATVVALAGCQGRETRISDEKKTVASWLSSAAFLTDSWIAGRVPSRLATITVRRIQSALDGEDKQLAKLGGSEIEQPRNWIANGRRSLDALAGAIRRSDRAAAAQPGQDLHKVAAEAQQAGESK